MGAMLSVLDAFQDLTLLEIAEKAGLEVMSAGVALAWATEAFEQGLNSEKETLAPYSRRLSLYSSTPVTPIPQLIKVWEVKIHAAKNKSD
jgi:aldehyde:ferredoxin oxidoreductase